MPLLVYNDIVDTHIVGITESSSMPKFRLIAGTHYRGSKQKGNLEKYVEGDVLEERFNLMRRHVNKFIRVPDDTAVSDPKENEDPSMGLTEDHWDRMDEMENNEPDYEAMTTKDLKRLAREQAIDITTVKSKAQLVSLLRTASALAAQDDGE